MTLSALAHSIMLARGWRRILIAFGAGAASVLALPPINLWPIPFLTFPILVWLVDGAAAGRLGGVLACAVTGWWFGFGYFLAGLYWVGNAFLVDAKTFGWLLPFAVIALPAGMALYPALGLALARADMDARADAGAGAGGYPHRRGVVAGASVQRLPLEYLRLCIDFTAMAGTDRGADRDLGRHLHCCRGLCIAGGTGRRPRRHAAAVACASAGLGSDRGHGGLRCDPACRSAHQLCRGGAASPDPAQSAAGREIQLFAEATGHEFDTLRCPIAPPDRSRPVCAM